MVHAAGVLQDGLILPNLPKAVLLRMVMTSHELFG